MNSQTFAGIPSPRVSVVMGVHRADPFIGAAVDSILHQTFVDFEFLIVVDAGSPEIRDYISERYPDDARIRLLEAPSLGGLALALNMGIAHARGEYIARMDADDISHPDRLQEQVSYLDANSAVAVVGCRVQLIDSNSETVNRKFPFYESDRQIRRVLPFKNPMAHPALLLRRSAIYAVRGYMYAHAGEDHEMLLRMARDPGCKLHNLDKLLFCYRRHDQQGTHPYRIKAMSSERSGVLFTEFLRTYSPRYLLAIFLIQPWLSRIRMAVRNLRTGSKE